MNDINWINAKKEVPNAEGTNPIYSLAVEAIGHPLSGVITVKYSYKERLWYEEFPNGAGHQVTVSMWRYFKKDDTDFTVPISEPGKNPVKDGGILPEYNDCPQDFYRVTVERILEPHDCDKNTPERTQTIYTQVVDSVDIKRIVDAVNNSMVSDRELEMARLQRKAATGSGGL